MTTGNGIKGMVAGFVARWPAPASSDPISG
jgi:hypothetical protein